MPSLMTAEMRAWVAAQDVPLDELERAPLSKTGFVGVILVKGRYQARVQVPGEGRGGSVKRRQHSLPGLFETATEAAICRAACIRDLRNSNNGVCCPPPKQDRQHKSRVVKKPCEPVATMSPHVPVQSPMPTAVGMPLSVPMFHVPFATVSPLPMQQLSYYAPLY